MLPERSVVACVLLFAAASPICRAQSAPTASPRERLNQYVAVLRKNPADDTLREEIIKLALTLDPKPAVPDEALKHEGAAEYAFRNAKSNAELTNAATEYEQALLTAPWLGTDYFNSAVAYEKAGEYKAAIRAFNFYILAAPTAPDAVAVKRRIGGLQYALDQANLAQQGQLRVAAAAAQQREDEARARQERRDRYPFEGTWNLGDGWRMVKIWNSGSGWSAGFPGPNGVLLSGNDPLVVKSVSGAHISLVEYTPNESACFAGEQQVFELDLSSDANSLVGKVQVAAGSCGAWDRGDHRMKWVSMLGKRVE